MNDLRSGIDLNFKHLLSFQQHKPLELSQLKPACASLAGRFRSSLKGRGMEFDEVRQYQAGDDIRTIDWRVTARTGKTHTKIFSEERERPVIILLDLSQTMCFGSQTRLKSFQAASLAARLLWSAKNAGDRFGALIFSDDSCEQIRPRLRSSTLMQIFSLILKQHSALIEKANEQQIINRQASLNSNLQRLHYLCKTGALIHLISDLSQFDEASKKSLALINRHNQVIAWQVQDPLEQQLPKLSHIGRLAVNNGHSQGLIAPDSKHWVQQYQQHASNKQAHLQTQLQQIGIPLQMISTDSELAQLHFQPKGKQPQESQQHAIYQHKNP